MNDTYKMPFGPQHPSLKESIYFNLELEGSEVKRAELNLGYMHKGVEKLLEDRLLNAALHTAEKICGICSFVHSECFTLAVERAMGIKNSEQIQLQRVIIGELERMHSHLMWAGLMMHDAGQETLFMLYWREREKILECFDKLTGNRVHHAVNLIGGAKYQFTKEDTALVMEKTKEVADYIDHNIKFLRGSDIVKERMHGVGVIPESIARTFGIVGPAARASGIKADVRKDDPYEAFDRIDFKVPTGTKGDARTRMLLRLQEIRQSQRIIEQAIEMMPYTKIPPYSLKLKDGQAYARCEAPRGENFHFTTVKDGRIVRHKVRTPTFMNIAIYPTMLQCVQITDVPIIIGSMDPCFSCMERVMLTKEGKTEVITGKEFMRDYCGHHD